MMQRTAAILPCLGEGSRMRPFSVGTPKVFLPFCGRPLLEYTLEQVRLYGIGTVVLVVSLSDTVSERYIRWGRDRGLKLIIAKRGLEFGSAGVVRHIVQATKELKKFSDFLVVYPDSVLSIDFGKMAKVHAARKADGCLLTVCHHKPEDLITKGQPHSNYGVLLTNRAARITSFVEKPAVTRIDMHHAASAGAIILDRRVLRLFPQSQPLDLSRDVIEPLARGGKSPVFGFDIGSGFRHDVGTIAEYVRKQFDVLSGRLTVTGVPTRYIHGDGPLRGGGTLTGKASVGPGCIFEKGVQLCGFNVIGRNVRVGRGSLIEDSVILDKTIVRSGVRIKGAVIGANCVIGDGIALGRGTALGDFSQVL